MNINTYFRTAMKRIILFLLLFISYSHQGVSQCNNPEDYTALRALYLSTDGDNWTVKTGWPTRAQFLANPAPIIGTDMSEWYGIRCGNGRVITISLQENNLSGSLPNFYLTKIGTIELSSNQISGSIPNFNLPSLKGLSLSDNQLSGSIPNFNLPNLSFLGLQSNQISGSIPNFNLLNLVELSLSSNQLSGTIPNFNLPNLVQLSLFSNQLSGTIPNFNLPNLVQLSLFSNQLSGSIPNFNLPNLQFIYISSNQLTGTIPNFNLPNLVQLSLFSNQLSGTIPNFNLPNLKDLSISNNQLTGTIPNFNLPNLVQLVLDRNQLNGTIPNFNLPKLQSLLLSDNQLSGSIPNFNLPNLKWLFLSDNQLTGTIPNFNLPNLGLLYLFSNQLTGTIPNFSLPNLELLWLFDNKLSGLLPYLDLPNLWKLNFNNNSLVGCIPSSYFKYCDSLLINDSNTPGTQIKVKPLVSLIGNTLLPWRGDFTKFCATDGSQEVQVGAPCNNGNPADGDNDVIQDDCSCGKVTGCAHPDYAGLMELYDSTNGPEWTNKTGWDAGKAGMSCDPCNYNGQPWYGVQCDSGRVTSLALRSNNLSGTIPNFNFPNLSALYLDYNSLTGEIPNFNFPNLSALNLSYNSLTGEIPNFNFPNLTILYLYNNNLIGSIPNFNLPKLSALNLENNFLTSSIPNFNLPELEFLDLNSNKFNGTLPIFNLKKLKRLNIFNNNLSGSIPDFNFPNLENLTLSNNNLSGSIPNFNFPNLKFISISNNQLSGCIPSFFKTVCFNNTGSNLFNPLLPWYGDFTQYCATDGSQQAQVGAPCNNGNPADGDNDVIQDDCSCGKVTGCAHPDDYTSLRELYLSADGDNWSIKTGWPSRAQFMANTTPPSGTDMSGWFGVSCENDRVRAIILSGCRLKGNLPNLNLPNLEYLYLGGNQLTGNIPQFNFTNLKALILANNEFSGSIPDFNLPNLASLILATNRLTGIIPNLSSPNLDRLELSGNQLTGTIPIFLTELDSLRFITLDSNKLSGCIDPKFKKFCQNGSFISMKNNPLLPWQGDFAQFCTTDGSQQAQVGAPCDNGDPADGENDVIQDDCSCGKVTGCAHPDYAGLMELYDSTNGPGWINKTGWDAGKAGISCDPCNYNGQPWYGLQCDSGRVITINLDVNNLNGEIPNLNLRNLTVISLAGNQLKGSIPNFNLPNLYFLGLYNNQLSGTLPNFNLPNLIQLYLRSNQLSGSIPNFNLSLLKLEELILTNNLLSGIIPNIKISSLRVISLSNNQLIGSIPNFNLPNLTGLSLYKNQLSGSIPNFNLPKLFQLELYSNQLSGTIPNLDLPNLGILNFGNNRLEGCVSSTYLKYCDSIVVADYDRPGEQIKVKPLVSLIGNPLLPWQGDFAQFCATDGSQQAQVGAPCDNRNSADGVNDVIQDDCGCGVDCNNAAISFSGGTILTCLNPTSVPIPLTLTVTGNFPNETPTISWSCSTCPNAAINNNSNPPTFDPRIAGGGIHFLNLIYQQRSCTWTRDSILLIQIKGFEGAVLNNDTLYLAPGVPESINIFENDLLPTAPFVYTLNAVNDSGITLSSLDSLGNLTVQRDEELTDEVLIGYTVCDECNNCSEGSIILINDKLRDIVGTTLITPDASSNNTLQFSALPIEDSELWIYNRWGQQIYRKKGYQNDWNGGGYPGGIYYYVLEVYGVKIKKALTIIK